MCCGDGYVRHNTPMIHVICVRACVRAGVRACVRACVRPLVRPPITDISPLISVVHETIRHQQSLRQKYLPQMLEHARSYAFWHSRIYIRSITCITHGKTVALIFQKPIDVLKWTKVILIGIIQIPISNNLGALYCPINTGPWATCKPFKPT